MSISISVICRKNRVSVKNKVTPCIRMIQDRKASYVSIGFALNVEYWDFENQKLSDNCPVKEYYQQLIDEKLKEFNKKIIYLEALGYEVTMDNLLGREGKNHNTIFVYFRKIIDQLKEKGTIRTAGKYESCLQSLIAFKSLDISFLEINLQFLNEFEIFLKKKGNVSNTIATKFSVLKAVYNKAIEDKIFICRENPFKKFKVGRLWTPTRKRAISKDEVLKIVNLDLSHKGGNTSPYLEFARDIFLFSYYTAGINFKDIANLKYSNIMDMRLYYKRNKTGKELTFHLLPNALDIIDKYKKNDASCEDYIFPILDRKIHVTAQQKFNREQKVLGHVNTQLEVIRKKIGLNFPLTTYVARHTYATVLKKAGVNIALISESLGHSDLSTTQIYLDSFENTQVDEAMKNLL